MPKSADASASTQMPRSGSVPARSGVPDTLTHGMGRTAGAGEHAGPTLGPEQSRSARRVLLLLGALAGCAMVGSASSLYLVNHHPLLLIALSPIGRHLVLVAPTVDPVGFLAVAVGRRMLFYLGSYQLGRALGPFGIAWLAVRAERMARFVRWVERLFARAPRTAVLTMAGSTVSALAGIHGMPRRVFAPVAAAGLTLRMLFVLAFAEWLREPIELLLAFIDEHWIPGTVLIVAGIALHQYSRWRRPPRPRPDGAQGELA